MEDKQLTDGYWVRPRCGCCEQLAPLLFRGPRGYVVHLDCDRCCEFVCNECSQEDEQGFVTCSLCLQADAERAHVSAPIF